MKRFRVGREIFYELNDAVEFAEIEGFSYEDIEILENEQENLNKIGHKIPDESSVMTSVEIVRQTKKDKGAEPERYNSQPEKYEDTLTTGNISRSIICGVSSL